MVDIAAYREPEALDKALDNIKRSEVEVYTLRLMSATPYPWWAWPWLQGNEQLVFTNTVVLLDSHQPAGKMKDGSACIVRFADRR